MAEMRSRLEADFGSINGTQPPTRFNHSHWDHDHIMLHFTMLCLFVFFLSLRHNLILRGLFFRGPVSFIFIVWNQAWRKGKAE